MPNFAVPKNSGVHRFACLALYRALLRQCSLSTRSTPWLGDLNSLVKQRFRRYKEMQSPSQIVDAMKSGYKSLDLIHSANKGNQRDISQLTAILSQAKALKEKHTAAQREAYKAKFPKPLSPRRSRRAEALQFQKETQRRHPNTQPILSRPHPSVSGKRRIPVLVNARGVPFLRIKKPQPRNLSGVIRRKLERRWHRIETRDRLQSELRFAMDEDAWDVLTYATESCTWAYAIESSLNDVQVKIQDSDRVNRELAEKLWDIVLRERKLAVEEEMKNQAEC